MTNPKSTGQVDDNQDDLGRDVNETGKTPADKAAERSRKIGLERPFKKDTDAAVSGGFNQKR